MAGHAGMATCVKQRTDPPYRGFASFCPQCRLPLLAKLAHLASLVGTGCGIQLSTHYIL
jgi:hypothetical protein